MSGELERRLGLRIGQPTDPDPAQASTSRRPRARDAIDSRGLIRSARSEASRAVNGSPIAMIRIRARSSPSRLRISGLAASPNTFTVPSRSTAAELRASRSTIDAAEPAGAARPGPRPGRRARRPGRRPSGVGPRRPQSIARSVRHRAPAPIRAGARATGPPAWASIPVGSSAEASDLCRGLARPVGTPFRSHRQSPGDLADARGQEDGHDGRPQDQVVRPRVEDPEVQGVLGQDEAELPDLRERGAEQERRADRQPGRAARATRSAPPLPTTAIATSSADQRERPPRGPSGPPACPPRRRTGRRTGPGTA